MNGENSLLINNVLDIKSDLIEFNLLFDELNSFLKKTILIDGEVFCYDEIKKLKESSKKLVNQISNEIVPSLLKEN